MRFVTVYYSRRHRRLGHAQGELQHAQRQPPAAHRSDALRPARRPEGSRPARRDARLLDRRFRPHAEDQQGCRPRPLAKVHVGRDGRGRHSRRTNIRRIGPHRRVPEGRPRPARRHHRDGLPCARVRPQDGDPRSTRPPDANLGWRPDQRLVRLSVPDRFLCRKTRQSDSSRRIT